MVRPKPPLRVLIVEDEALLAMDIEAMVQDCGHQVVGEAACLADVEDMQITVAPDLAFIDIQLAHGSSGLDVSELISQRWEKAAIVFVTANPKKIPEGIAGAFGVIPKPFTRNGLISALRFIEEGVCKPPPVGLQPPSFVAYPAFAESWK